MWKHKNNNILLEIFWDSYQSWWKLEARLRWWKCSSCSLWNSLSFSRQSCVPSQFSIEILRITSQEQTKRLVYIPKHFDYCHKCHHLGTGQNSLSKFSVHSVRTASRLCYVTRICNIKSITQNLWSTHPMLDRS